MHRCDDVVGGDACSGHIPQLDNALQLQLQLQCNTRLTPLKDSIGECNATLSWHL